MTSEDKIKILIDSMGKMAKVSVASSLEYLKNGFEAFKKVEIPMISQAGHFIKPYENSKELQYIVEFMIIYLEEAIKQIDNKKGVFSK